MPALPAQPRAFHRLRQGRRGHRYQQLFYLETADFLDDDIPTEVAAIAAFPKEAADPATAEDTAVQPVVSLHTIAGIRTEDTMMHLHVYIHGHHLLALLDSGSTHHFLNNGVMRQLQLSTSAHPTMRIVMANGDRVPCEGVARNIAMAIGTEEFSISCFGINLGGFDVILGVDFLRTLGPILWDFEDMCMAFTRGSRRILWARHCSTMYSSLPPPALGSV